MLFFQNACMTVELFINRIEIPKQNSQRRIVGRDFMRVHMTNYRKNLLRWRSLWANIGDKLFEQNETQDLVYLVNIPIVAHIRGYHKTCDNEWPDLLCLVQH